MGSMGIAKSPGQPIMGSSGSGTFSRGQYLQCGFCRTVTMPTQLSEQTLYGHAQDFLARLSMFRETDETKDRPIIFIAHSLGRIILKSQQISDFNAITARFHMKFFYETLPTTLPSAIIVPKASAILPGAVNIEPISIRITLGCPNFSLLMIVTMSLYCVWYKIWCSSGSSRTMD
ncbi:hypothetical protein BU17DRAFT_70845 [Hysterangium stoloniferum]|nr:hypothetical protein BU17DRAFT_70845 [Hysterangium stoloniferum]